MPKSSRRKPASPSERTPARPPTRSAKKRKVRPKKPAPAVIRDVEVYLDAALETPPLADPILPPAPALPLAELEAQLKNATATLANAVAFASTLDTVGPATSHPSGSADRKAAELRDDLDFVLQLFVSTALDTLATRAQTSFSAALLHRAATITRGDAHLAGERLRRFQERLGMGPNDDALRDSLPALFASDTAERVSLLRQLAHDYPAAVRVAAADMPGWPMLVSAHLDPLPELELVTGKLQVGAAFFLDGSKRKRRFSASALVPYLTDLLERLQRLRLELQLASKRSAFVRGGKKHRFLKAYLETRRETEDQILARTAYLDRPFPQPEAAAEVAEVLRQLRDVPNLTQASLLEWINKIIVPFIMLGDAATAKSCQITPLKKIWSQRDVPSRGAFKSRLRTDIRHALKRLVR